MSSGQRLLPAICLIAVGVAMTSHGAVADECHSRQSAYRSVAIDPCLGTWPGCCSSESFCGPGWSCGGFHGVHFGIGRYRSFTYATPGLWCGWSYPCGTPVYGWGCNPFLPRVWVPPVVCYPGSFAPAFGPMGVYPFLGWGCGPRGGMTILQIGRGPTVHVRQAAVAPRDPVFGDRPLGGPSLLAERSSGLIGGIFGSDAGRIDLPNWIADRWSRQVDGNFLVAARR